LNRSTLEQVYDILTEIQKREHIGITECMHVVRLSYDEMKQRLSLAEEQGLLTIQKTMSHASFTVTEKGLWFIKQMRELLSLLGEAE